MIPDTWSLRWSAGRLCRPRANEDDVHARVLPGERREAVGCHLLMESEVLDEEGTGRGDILDGQRYGG
jgi:hypothetical protein